MLKEDKNKKRKERHHITQEDFTPSCVVDEMLKNLPTETFTNFKKNVLDFSCGIGNFLIEILNRRLANCNTPDDVINAIKTIYGVELMADNVEECRTRLYNAIVVKFPQIKDDYLLNFKVRSIIRNRIKWYDSMQFDYKWESLRLTPQKKRMNVSFKELQTEMDTKYPMWYKEYNIFEPSLFGEEDFL